MTNDQRLVDPEPITIACGIIGATLGVVTIIDTIRKALRERDSDAREARTESLKRQKIGLQRLDARLALIEDELKGFVGLFGDEPRYVEGTQRILVDPRTYEEYCVRVQSLVEQIPKLIALTLELEPTLDPEVGALGRDDMDELDEEGDRALQRFDQLWHRAHPVQRIWPHEEYDPGDPFQRLIDVISIYRKKINLILDDPLISEL